MKDKSKRLTVVNTEKKPSEKKEVQQVIVQPSSSSSSHAPGFNPNLYLLKSVWDSVFEIKTDVSGQKYIFGKLPVVTKYGITMYADDGSVEIPQLAEGLPYDQRTIWFNPETKQIEVIGGTGGGGEGGVSNFWDLSGIPSWITSTKPTYSYSEIQGTPDLSVFVTSTALSETLADYATLTYLTGELKKYVTIKDDQDIVGVKNFLNGIKISHMPIRKLQDDVIYIDANLVVRGGITMYAENEVNIPSILDSLPIASNTALGIASFDSAYFSVDSNGMVTLTSAPSSGASSLGELLNVDTSIDATASVDRILYQPQGSSVWTWRELPKDGVVGDYLPLSGGTLNGTLSIGTTISSDVGRATLGLVSVGDNPTDFKMGNGSLVWSITARNNAGRKNMWFYSYVSNNILIELDATFNAVRIGRGTESLIDYLDPEYSLDVVGTLRSNRGVFKSSSANILSLYRTESGGGAWIDYYAYNQTSSKWRVGAGGIYDFMWEAPDGNYPCRIHYNKSNGIRFEIGKDFTTTGTITDPSRATLTLISTSDNPTDLIMGANAYDWSITARGSSDDYFLGIYSNRNSQYVTKFFRGGNVLVTGGITMYSDQRKKTILNHVELSLKQIADAPLIEHYYNSDQEKTTHVGSIAQYWAGLNDWFCKLDAEGYYTMEIQNAALASAISIARHLEKYESKTDKKIRQLKKRISQLEDELELLKKGV